MRRKKFKGITVLLACIFANYFGVAQIPQVVKDEIKTRVDNGIYPSVAVGVWENGQERYFIYGYKNNKKQEKADKNTLYEIGSITKTYTALLLAKYVTTGKLKLEDAADSFLPDTIKLRDEHGKAILLKQLSTHTSGLPRLPDNMDHLSLDNPYRDYTRKDLFAFLHGHKTRDIGERYLYSNLAVGLLGEILAISQNSSYSHILKKDVLLPLHLEHTYLNVPKEQSAHRATGYTASYAVNAWDFKALAGAGALKATITDLLAYGKSYLDKENPLKKAADLTMQSHFTDKNERKYGLGWHFSDGIAWHNGGTGGFRSFIGIDTTNQKVVAVLTNSGTSNPDDIAMYLTNPDDRKLHLTPEVVDILPEKLQNYTGSYQNNGMGLKMDFRIKDSTLYAQIPGQPELPVYYSGNHDFFYKAVLARIQFEADEDDTIVGLTLYQNGREILLIKN